MADAVTHPLPYKFLIARNKVTRKIAVISTETWKPISEHDNKHDAIKAVNAALQEAGR